MILKAVYVESEAQVNSSVFPVVGGRYNGANFLSFTFLATDVR